MQLELGRYLKILKVDDEVYQSLNEATLVGVSSWKQDTGEKGFELQVEIPRLLDVSIYERLRDYADKADVPTRFYLVQKMSDDDDIDNSYDDLAVNAYFAYFLKKHFSDSPLYEALSHLKLIEMRDQIIISVNTQILQESMNQYINLLRFEFAYAGFSEEVVIQFEKIADAEVAKLMEEAKAASLATMVPPADIETPEDTDGKQHFHRTRDITISDELKPETYVHFKGRVFSVERKDFRGYPSKYIIGMTDDKNSLFVTARKGRKLSEKTLNDIKEEQYLEIVGHVQEDNYQHDVVVEAYSIQNLGFYQERYDAEEDKRIELHLHTNYSTLDGVCDIDKYAALAASFGHPAIAITDHGGVQGFPEAQDAADKYKLKMIYGMEGYLVDEKYEPLYNPRDLDLNHATYVSFDLETTGLNPRYDEIIEIGAVKYKDSQIVDTFQTFVNPKRRISKFTTELCGITDEDVIGAPLLEEVAANFRKFVGDGVLVAHNASFDYNFINEAFRKRHIPVFGNAVIDTLALARCIMPGKKSYSLGGVARAVNVDYDEISAHRADYDANVLGNVLLIMLNQVVNDLHITNLKDLPSLTPVDAYVTKHPFHVTMLVKNKAGLKNLYRIVSESNVKYLNRNKLPMIPRSLLADNREGLLVGSACYNGEVFDLAKTGTEAMLRQAIKNYDYIEIQPLANYQFLLETGEFEDEASLVRVLKDIVRIAEEEKKLVVATGDCHYLNPRDRIYRDAYIVWHPKNQSANHPLFDSKKRSKQGPMQHYRTTREMLDGISFVGEEKAKEYVVTNTHKIADMIEVIKPIGHALCAPVLPGIDVQKEIEKLCDINAKRIYGDPIPPFIAERLERELKSLRENNYAVIYYLAYRLVMKSKEDGYLVGSRGSVGSSFVATMCGITEVNPLPPHYICPQCHHLEMIVDGSYASGYDLPPKLCPECGHIMDTNGQNIPFETFLGLHGDKVPDIDLNFASDNQPQAHEYTKVLLDANHVFRAGTIATVQSNTAFGVARNYFEYNEKFDLRKAEYQRLAHYCSGTKRTTGQHPGGIVVVPLDKDILDFTPVQYPADDQDAHWLTTHLTYESMHDQLLKLDILGHEDPMALRMLQELTGVDPETIPLNDPKVLSLFTSTDALHVTPLQIYSETGVSGIPEFGTENAKRILADARPTKFSELVQISGLSHGTGVWSGNAQDLIRTTQAGLMDVIGCRDDVMTYLVHKGMDEVSAFKIMETVRKKNKYVSKDQEEAMRKIGVPDFYIDSTKKIEYLFPKAHAVAYVSMALRVAWYKVYYPIEYYATFFSVRCAEYDIETMIKGGPELVQKMQDSLNIANDRSRNTSERKKAADLYDALLLTVEFFARGFSFANISLTESDSKNFVISESRTQLYPPFSSISGLGVEAAKNIVAARKEKPFISQEDFSKRAKINKTILKTLEKMGVLQHIQSEAQMSLDLFEE